MAIKKQNIAPFDVDAQRFILAAGLTRYADKRGIIYLVQNLKANGLWNKFLAIYPMVGGTATSCKFNLKDPRDIDTSYRLIFVSSPIISYNGIDWNAAASARTNLVPSSTSIGLDDAHLSYYSRTNIVSASQSEIGSIKSAVPPTIRFYFGLQSTYGMNSDGSTSFSNPDTRGMFIVTRTTSTLVTMYRNGVSVSTNTNTSTALCPFEVYLGARNFDGSPLNQSQRQCAFASVGLGFTAAQSFTFSQIVQQFQIILNRAV